MKFIVIGITDNPQPFFPPEVMDVIRRSRIFSGGRRHHALVADLLPEGAEWIDIMVPVEGVMAAYRERMAGTSLRNAGAAQVMAGDESFITIFASGDPLFFGFANTLRRLMPEAEIQLFPTFNSLQLLAHRLVLPYHDLRIVSLTGRPWPEFDRALIEHAPKIGILTDREHTPAAIARRMLEYGYTQYVMHVGEHLGNPQAECIATLSLEDAATSTFTMPNCIILAPLPAPPVKAEAPLPAPPVGGEAAKLESSPSALPPEISSKRPRGGQERGLRPSFGLPDSSFALLDGREKMITKMPIRLLTLQALELPKRHVLWDIGACTGSVSIEARLLFPHLQIEAFEIRPECEAIIRENCRRHGAPGIGVHIGDFLDSPTLQGRARGESLSPDAVFIGGHGGRLKEIMAKVLTVLAPDGVIVMNSVVAPKVTTDSHRLWDEACAELGLKQEPPMRIQLNDHHPITILKAHQ